MRRITKYDVEIYKFMGDRIQDKVATTQEEKFDQIYQYSTVWAYYLGAANGQLQVIKYMTILIFIALLTIIVIVGLK